MPIDISGDYVRVREPHFDISFEVLKDPQVRGNLLLVPTTLGLVVFSTNEMTFTEKDFAFSVKVHRDYRSALFEGLLR